MCLGAARGRIRDGHCRDCNSSLRVVDAIGVGLRGRCRRRLFAVQDGLGDGRKVPPRAGPIEDKSARPPLSSQLSRQTSACVYRLITGPEKTKFSIFGLHTRLYEHRRVYNG